MLSGDNGILQKATIAKENSDKAQIEERIKLAYHSALTGGQGSYTKGSLEEELEKEFGEEFEEVDDSNDTNWILKAKGQSVIIPAGTKDVIANLASEIFEWIVNTEGKMHIGDYVNFGVDYDNLYTNNDGDADKPDDIYAGKWRVLYITSEKIKLVSAGVPIRYCLNGVTNENAEAALTWDKGGSWPGIGNRRFNKREWF